MKTSKTIDDPDSGDGGFYYCFRITVGIGQARQRTTTSLITNDCCSVIP